MPTNALDYITIKGFKSIASIEKLPLKPINVVIGPNGSGKSNFIGALGFLNNVCEGRLREYVTVAGGAEKGFHFGSKRTKESELELSFHRVEGWPYGSAGYKLILSPTADDGLFPSAEATYLNGPSLTGLIPREHGREAGISDPKAEFEAKFVREHLLKWRLYHFDDTSSSSP